MNNTNEIYFELRRLLSGKMIVELPENEYQEILASVQSKGPGKEKTIESTINSVVMHRAQRSYEAEHEIRLMKNRAKRKKLMEEEDQKRIDWLKYYLIDHWIISKRPLIDPEAPDDFSRVSNKPIRTAQALSNQPLQINWDNCYD